MAHAHFIADELDYGRDLLQAGIEGIRAGERQATGNDNVHIATSACESLKAAAVGGALALLLCKLIDHRKTPVARVFACSGAAFCADFIWRTRSISSRALKCAEKEMAKVRDQHWLDSHPIDYA